MDVGMEAQPAQCVVCRCAETLDRYEFDEYEMDTLVHELKIRNAERIQRKHGSLPVCESCWEDLSFSLEEDEAAAAPPLVELKLSRPKTPANESKKETR